MAARRSDKEHFSLVYTKKTTGGQTISIKGSTSGVKKNEEVKARNLVLTPTIKPIATQGRTPAATLRRTHTATPGKTLTMTPI